MAEQTGGNQTPQQKKQPEQNPRQQNMRSMLPWLIMTGILAISLIMMNQNGGKTGELPYTAPDKDNFVQLVNSGKVARCEIVTDVSGLVYAKCELKKDAKIKDAPNGKFKTYLTSRAADKDFLNWLGKNHVEVEVPPGNHMLWGLITNFLPIVLIFGLIYFFFIRQMRSAGHGAMSFGKSRARLLNRDRNKITFKDVAGINEAKADVEEIIDFLKDPQKFHKLGGRIPKGVMLMGPPGTGKTLLAKAIAGEADVPFFSISGSDFIEMFVGVGASRVRDMFVQGKKNAPCIIFIDEIDAVGRSRFTGIGGGHDEREQTLNALLVEMDGFESREGVIIIAATNRPDVLDPALLRKGRFDRQIVIDLPMIEGRADILKIHAKQIKLAADCDLHRIARGTPGFSGADLENLLNEAALGAARLNKKEVEMSDMEEARDKVMWGSERKSRAMDDKEKKITAYHEAGHALVQQLVEESEPLHKVTIIPRGIAYLGATMSLPEKDTYTTSRKKLISDLAISMGGRTAEKIIFGDITNGASQDIRHATEIARLMVCNWGMSDELGPQEFGQNQELMFLGREVSRQQNFSDSTAERIDNEISKLLTEASESAHKLISENRDKLEMIAERLLERETIEGRDITEIVEHGRVLSKEERDEIDRKKEEEEQKKNPTPQPPPIPQDTITEISENKSENDAEDSSKSDSENSEENESLKIATTDTQD